MTYVDYHKQEIMAEAAKLKQTAQLAKQLDAYRVVFEKTDRIMSGTPVGVRIVLEPPQQLAQSPGWTDGQTISLNGAMMAADLGKHSMESIILRSRGINYHELSHILYTPRDEDDMLKWIERGMYAARSGAAEPWRRLLWTAFMYLEDQRIETMFTSRYRASVPYFRAAALRWLIANKEHAARVHLLVHGRKFLSKKVRDRTRAAFAAQYGDDKADRAAEIIDKYIRVQYPTTVFRAQSLVGQFAELISETIPDESQLPDHSSGGHGSVSGAGYDRNHASERNASSNAQREAQKAMDEQEDQWDEDEDADDTEADGQGEAGDDADDSTEDFGGDNEADGGDESDEDDFDSEGFGDSDDDDDADEDDGTDSGDETDSDSAEQGGASAGGSPDTDFLSPDEADSDAVRQFYDDLSDLLNDEQLQKELTDVAQTVRDIMNDRLDIVDGQALSGGTREVTPDQAAVSAVHRMGNALAQLRTDLEEEHVHRQQAGSLDPKRFFERKPWEFDIFKTYEPGQYDEAKVEAVVLCDFSGSMSRIMENVSVSMWTLRRALESVDARTTVLGYSDEAYALFQPNDPTPRDAITVYRAMGGTDPRTALRAAHQVFTRSDRTNKLLITITDGAWGCNDAEVVAIMDGIHGAGAVSCLLELLTPYDTAGSQWSNPLGYRHDHQMYLAMKGVSQLPEVGTQLVAEMMRAMAAAV